MVIKYNFIISFQRALSYTKAAFGSLAEWFKAPDLGSGIFGCVSSNLTALIFFPYTAVLQSARSVFYGGRHSTSFAKSQDRYCSVYN